MASMLSFANMCLQISVLMQTTFGTYTRSIRTWKHDVFGHTKQTYWIKIF